MAMTATASGANSRREAINAVKALQEALDTAGIVLPSLAVDTGSVFSRFVLVELGRARPDVVMRLAAAIRKEAECER